MPTVTPTVSSTVPAAATGPSLPPERFAVFPLVLAVTRGPGFRIAFVGDARRVSLFNRVASPFDMAEWVLRRGLHDAHEPTAAHVWDGLRWCDASEGCGRRFTLEGALLQIEALLG